MEKHSDCYLCGGTFLAQLLRFRRSKITPNEYVKGEKESLSEQEMFRRLISIFQLSEFVVYIDSDSLKTNTSSYKRCKKNLL